jgi:hypothetical protein
MRKIRTLACQLAATAVVLTMLGSAFAQSIGTAVFSASGAVYAGQVDEAGQSLAVEIDGLQYRGNFSQTDARMPVIADEAASGDWGRAFLFASSASVLQCRLESGLPTLRGTCLGADGRLFRLEAALPAPNASTPSAHQKR